MSQSIRLEMRSPRAAGDKSGGSERKFYTRLVAKADRRFSDHLAGPRGANGECEMDRSLKEVVAALPIDEQTEIEGRYRELRREVEGLAELRVAARTKTDPAKRRP